MLSSLDKNSSKTMFYFFWIVISFPFFCLFSILLGKYVFKEIEEFYGLMIMAIPSIHIVFVIMILNEETRKANNKQSQS